MPASVVIVWMLNMTPEVYIQVRTRNGISWLKSSAPAPSRARNRPMPTLNTAWSSRAGMASSQYQVSGSPVASTMTMSTTMDMASCSSSISTYPTGRQPRGNGSALIRGRLSGITRDVVMNARWVKLKMNIPVMRKARKFGTPRLVPRIRPKIR